MRVFDTHTHIGTARHSGRSYSADELLRNMDRHAIERSVVIPFPVVEDPREQHDILAAAVKRYPDRLTACACVPPYSSGFQEEVKRCAQDYGFRALKLQPQYHGLNPLSNDFFFETALRYEMTVICHTGTGLPFSLPSLLMMPARKFPDLNIVVAHCGGGIFVHDAIVAASFCPNISLELSSLMPHHIHEVLQHIDASRLMIGSDLPESTEVEIGKIRSLEIPDSQKSAILYDTAARIFDRC